MKFLRGNKTKLIRRERMRIEVRYFEDGGMESHVQSKDPSTGSGGKWETSQMTYFAKAPSWDDLHKCHYIGKGEDCFQPPAPIEGLIAHMKYVAHCLSIGKP